MPVTFPIFHYDPEVYRNPEWATPAGVVCHKGYEKVGVSFHDVIVTKNGFMRGVVAAHALHHNLVIRPDDVWIAILSQLSFYIDAHTQDLRSMFSRHRMKRGFVVKTPSSLSDADYDDMANQIIGQINSHVKDKTLAPWLLPNFSTTTIHDKVTCSAAIISTMKHDFKDVLMDCGGIPFLTLEGTKADWNSILGRIERLPEFGFETKHWAMMLRVILKRFVSAFDRDGPRLDRGFWEKMVFDRVGASTTPYLSGWIVAFCAWDNKGDYLLRDCPQDPHRKWVSDLAFDGVWFPRVYKAPDGFAEVDVTFVDDAEPGNVKQYQCTMLPVHFGFYLDGRTDPKPLTVRIAPQWFLYLRGEWEHLRGLWREEDSW